MSMWLDLLGCEYRMGFAQAGPIRTRFLEAGFGHPETIVFLHGSGGYLEAFLRNIAAHATRYRVFAIDMIGHGCSDKPDRPYQPADYVRHLLDFLDAMGVQRAHLSGESLGGWVAFRSGLIGDVFGIQAAPVIFAANYALVSQPSRKIRSSNP